jgi:hypothetical protein
MTNNFLFFSTCISIKWVLWSQFLEMEHALPSAMQSAEIFSEI